MPERELESNRLFEIVIRLGVLGVLLYMTIRAIAPFLEILVWGIILAVALGPAHLWLTKRLGDAAGRAAAVLTLGALLFIVVPSFLLGDALGTTAYEVAEEVADGEIEIPPPPASVKEWPVVGERVFHTWSQASTNLDAVLKRSSDRLVELGASLLRAAGAAVLALLEFAGSLILAGFLLAQRARTTVFARDLFDRLAPQSGERLMLLSEQTVRGVAAGVVGVAIIQSVLVGLGLLVAGVPFAGVWALVCLILGIIQLPMGIVVIPIVIYQFSAMPVLEAGLLAAYMVPVMLADNVLKPLLMGRGVEAPMLVIFIGALGGFAASGFLGLFTGAIVVVLVNDLLLAWLRGPGVPETAVS